VKQPLSRAHAAKRVLQPNDAKRLGSLEIVYFHPPEEIGILRNEQEGVEVFLAEDGVDSGPARRLYTETRNQFAEVFTSLELSKHMRTCLRRIRYRVDLIQQAPQRDEYVNFGSVDERSALNRSDKDSIFFIKHVIGMSPDFVEFRYWLEAGILRKQYFKRGDGRYRIVPVVMRDMEYEEKLSIDNNMRGQGRSFFNKRVRVWLDDDARRLRESFQRGLARHCRELNDIFWKID
ncbi:MAG: hypothetical protein MJA83_20525, partial [Gammaproteobacteria bacterium]|nr:hypothetical protein [Gammaproteobacteria bacterium]